MSDRYGDYLENLMNSDEYAAGWDLGYKSGYDPDEPWPSQFHAQDAWARGYRAGFYAARESAAEMAAG